jgi:glyoxylase-like metal-dependent hydrolase (beta-lactamase superfamily II)
VEGNCTIIINDDDVVVVDATGSPQGARQIIKEIKKLTDKPVRYLINTHGHGDHTIGNTEFLKAFPGINIIAHPETRNYLTAKEKRINYVKDIANSIDSRINYMNAEIQKVKEEAYPGYEKVIANLEQYRDHDLPLRQETYKEVIITPPNVTFEDRVILHSGDREIHLLHPGKGDTAGDVWVYLPHEKVLCSGDAVVHPVPYGFSRHGIEWLQTLRKVAELDFTTLIPGHGEVQRDKEYLKLYITLLEEVSAQINKSIESGLTKEETIKKININEIEERFTKGDALRRYYFNEYFKEPHFDRIYDLIKNEYNMTKADNKK